jgi:hypothetical protein
MAITLKNLDWDFSSMPKAIKDGSADVTDGGVPAIAWVKVSKACEGTDKLFKEAQKLTLEVTSRTINLGPNSNKHASNLFDAIDTAATTKSMIEKLNVTHRFSGGKEPSTVDVRTMLFSHGKNI